MKKKSDAFDTFVSFKKIAENQCSAARQLSKSAI